MPPINGTSYRSLIQNHITEQKVVVFTKSNCPKSKEVKDLFKSIKQEFKAVEFDTTGNAVQIQQGLLEAVGDDSVPSIFINGIHVGGSDVIQSMKSDGRLAQLLQGETEYDYDLIVIGGGSGGLAAAKEAAQLGMKAAVFDFVKPTPKDTVWGLGGTCVNVGCIPKKLMHQASLLGHQFEDAKEFGWDVPESIKHDWIKMKDAIQDHIASLNWNYRVQLREESVDYHNAYAEFVDAHKIKGTNRRGKVIEKTAKYFLLAMGERPRYPNIPGAVEHCITSDDLFSLPYCPGKTLVVGASYVSLECGGFLASLGFDVTVMVRSILLRGFDQQMAEKVGEYMANHNVKFIRPCVPTSIEKIEDGEPGKLRVTAKHQDGREIVDEYNTVILAVGRDPCTKGIGLDKVGVQLNKAGFVIADDRDKTSVPNIYAIGDILEGKPELTPVAIQAGRLLMRRLFGESSILCDYINVATTVFTPLEYGAIGYSEEDAVAKFGEENIEVYHKNFMPLEWTVPHREENACYAKLICHIPDNERVIGLHVVGPNAGEITQGYSVGMRLGATKTDFNATIGIHPTCSEIFTLLDVTKRSGKDISQDGC